MAPIKTGPQTRKELADALGVKVTNIGYHIRAGDHPPINDVEAWKNLLAVKRRNKGGSPDVLSDLAQARHRLTIAQALRAEREERHAAGEIIDLAEARAACRTLMADLFATLDRIFCVELPPSIAGMNELDMRAKCRIEIEALKKTLREQYAALAREQPKA